MKLKKLLSLLLCVTMSITLFACGNDGNGGSGSSDSIRMFIIQGNYYDGAEKDRVWEYIEEKIGAEITIEGALNNDDYYTTLNPMLNTGDFPDVFFSASVSASGSYGTWSDPDDGILWNLDELFAMYPGEFPNLEAYINSEQYRNIQFSGQHTLIPYVSEASGWGVYWREDWLKNVGEVDENGNAIVPTTLEDFERVLYKFKEDDPDQNGKDDTYGLSPGCLAHFFLVFIHAFGGCSDWDLSDDNKLEYQYNTEECRNCLKWLNKLYQDGVIDPQFNTNSSDSDREDFENSKMGCIITNSCDHVQWVAEPLMKIKGYDGTVVMGVAPVGTGTIGPKTGLTLGVEGASGFNNWGGYWGGYSITKACKNPKAVLKFFDYMLSEEGLTLMYNGIEGIHYTKDEEGNITPNLEERKNEPDGRWKTSTDENGEEQPTGRWTIGVTLCPNVVYESSVQGKNYAVYNDYSTFKPQVKKLAEDGDRLRVLYNSKLTNISAYPSTVSMMMSKISDESSAFFIQAIMGKKNLTTDWEAMLKTCDDLGWKTVQSAVLETAESLGII